jgi:hydroxymethylglutaryl-CoA lyase
MAFGNPYQESYHTDMVLERLYQAEQCGADLVSLSDTTGHGNKASIKELCELMTAHANVPWGAHLHSTYEEATDKARTAMDAGCRRIDTALRGYGGCPFASDAMIGNMPTEKVLSAIEESNYKHVLNPLSIENAFNSALTVFDGLS